RAAAPHRRPRRSRPRPGRPAPLEPRRRAADGIAAASAHTRRSRVRDPAYRPDRHGDASPKPAIAVPARRSARAAPGKARRIAGAKAKSAARYAPASVVAGVSPGVYWQTLAGAVA